MPIDPPPTRASAAIRPRPVTAAVRVLYALAGKSMIGVPVTLATLAARDELTAGTGVAMPTREARLTVMMAVGTGLVTAAAFILLGLLNSRGSRAARAVTLVCAWLMIASFVCTSITFVPPLREHVLSRWPDWYRPVTLTNLVIFFAAGLGLVILMTRPAAKVFFGKPEAAAPADA